LAPKAQWRRVGTARKGDSRALGVEADARREDLGVLKLRVVANTAPPAGGPYPRLRPISRTLGKATLLDLLVYFEVRPSVARIIVRGGVAKRPAALPGGSLNRRIFARIQGRRVIDSLTSPNSSPSAL
jgi:hypothetical protein